MTALAINTGTPYFGARRVTWSEHVAAIAACDGMSPQTKRAATHVRPSAERRGSGNLVIADVILGGGFPRHLPACEAAVVRLLEDAHR